MDTAVSEAIEAHFQRVQDRIHAPQLAFGLRVAGETVDLSNPSLPFRIASMTKSFTAAAVLLLRDRGALQLDQPIAELVPELVSLVAPTTDSPPISVRHLLTMSSGLAFDDPWADRQLGIDSTTLDSLFARGARFAAAVGTSYVYSNYGYAMLGRAVSNVARMPFQRFISAELLAPLGMAATGWDVPDDFAAPNRVIAGMAVADTPPPLGDGGFAAMGGLWSNVTDLLRWVDFMLDSFPARDDLDDAPLRRSTRREMQQGCRASPPMTVELDGAERTIHGGYGMGLRAITESKLGDLVSHTGGLPGYGSNMMWHPNAMVGIVSLANVTYAPMSVANLEALDIVRIAGKLANARARATPALAERGSALVGLVNNWNDAHARTIFASNVELDEVFDSRAQAVHELIGNRGPLTIISVASDNATQASALLADQTGRPAFEISFSLSPEMTPRIQAYELRALDFEESAPHAGG
jgi:CubicO group peptidase (beta-lactamase class C family)